MAKGATKNPFGLPAAKRTAPAKAKEMPAPRRSEFERLLRTAIDSEKLVSLRYTDDVLAREFEPGVLYYSQADRNQVNVGGCQIKNPNEPQSRMEPRVFEVGKIVSLTITHKPFVLRDAIDLLDRRYANGILHHFKKR